MPSGSAAPRPDAAAGPAPPSVQYSTHLCDTASSLQRRWWGWGRGWRLAAGLQGVARPAHSFGAQQPGCRMSAGQASTDQGCSATGGFRGIRQPCTSAAAVTSAPLASRGPLGITTCRRRTAWHGEQSPSSATLFDAAAVRCCCLLRPAGNGRRLQTLMPGMCVKKDSGDWEW